MIPIRYSGGTLPKLDALCSHLQKKAKDWVNVGYVGDKKSHVVMDNDTRKLFSYLSKVNVVNGLVNLHASKLTKLIELMEKQFPQLAIDRKAKEVNPKASVSILYKCIQKAFSNYGFDSDSFPAEDLMDDLDLTVCPYCNRNFVKSIKVKHGSAGKDIFVKGQMDHFYPRSLYPYLAICKHNLVPSCPSCNGASGKHDDNTRTKKVVNPYLLNDSNGMRFKMSIVRKGFANMQTCAKAISIDVDCTANPDLANNEDIFHLKKIYATHTDYAAEIYYKSILRLPNVYKQYIGKRMYSHGININKKDFERLLLGVYTQEKDYSKRPLSKFCSDIALQRHLIP